MMTKHDQVFRMTRWQRIYLTLWQRFWHRRLDRVVWAMSLGPTRVLCRLGVHRRAYGGTHASGPEMVTVLWCPGGCKRTWERRVPVLTESQVFERDVLRPLMETLRD